MASKKALTQNMKFALDALAAYAENPRALNGRHPRVGTDQESPEVVCSPVTASALVKRGLATCVGCHIKATRDGLEAVKAKSE